MKNFLIIGGSSGIGLALCDMLLREGHAVYSTFRIHRSDIKHPNHIHFRLDVSEPRLDFSLLPDQLDGLVYCPGSIELKPFARIKPADFVGDFEMQVVGAVKVIQGLLDRLKNSKQASIVLFSSVAASHGFNFHSLVSASKAALEGLAWSLAAEFAPKIRVNVVAPSITNTPLAARFLNTHEKQEGNAKKHALKRVGTSQDVAHAAKYLLTNESSWMTGQILRPDGGMSRIYN